MLIVGSVLLALSIADLRAAAPPIQWWVLVALTLVSGSAVLKLPAIPVSFSISDVFTLTGAVVFGAPAGTVIVAIDSLAISMRLARNGLPLRKVLFNAAAPPVAMWVSAQLFFLASGLPALSGQRVPLELVLPWLLLFAAVYFVLNTFVIAAAVALDQRVSILVMWRTHFQNLWMTFLGGALGAGIVVFALQIGPYGIVVLFVPMVLAAILHFAYHNATGRVADQMQHLAEVNRLHLSTIEALAHAIDAKDSDTHGHIRRVQSWAVMLATRVGLEDPLQLRALEVAALLHDVGKLAVPEHILNKPGKLTPAEFNLMKTHATVGAEILSEVEFPYPVVPIVRHHHENWDGTGYPDGLRGRDIPIGARILSVVDCFDALTSDRPYRRAMSTTEACAILQARRDTMYDPVVVDAFRDLCASLAPADLAAAPAVSTLDRDEPVSRTDDDEGIDVDEVHVAVSFGAALADASAGDGLRAIVQALRTLPDVDTVALFVVDDRQHRLIAHETAGGEAALLDRLTIPIGERVSGWVAATRQNIVNGDAALDLFDTGAKSLRSAIAVSCGGSRAVITLYSTRPQAFSSYHERLLEIAASFLESVDGWPRLSMARHDRPRLASLVSREDAARLPSDWFATRSSRLSLRRATSVSDRRRTSTDPRR